MSIDPEALRHEHPEMGWELLADKQPSAKPGSHDDLPVIPHGAEPITQVPEFTRGTPLSAVSTDLLAGAGQLSPADLDTTPPKFGVPSADEQQQSHGFWTRPRKLGAAVVAVLVLGGGAALLLDSGGSKEKLPAAASNATPGRSNAPGIANNTGVPSGESIGLTQESLDKMVPIPAVVEAGSPYGSEKAIKTIYKNLQLADQTGRMDFLETAIGSQNITSSLGTGYTQNIAQFQQYFEQNPDQQLTFRYEATSIRQSSTGSTTWNVIAVQNTGGTIERTSQRITLEQQTEPDGKSRWILKSVDAAIPIK